MFHVPMPCKDGRDNEKAVIGGQKREMAYIRSHPIPAEVGI